MAESAIGERHPHAGDEQVDRKRIARGRRGKFPRERASGPAVLLHCHFDRVKAHKGIECLRNYQAKIDHQKGIMLDKPVHDKFSHGSDAFRYLIQGLSLDRSEDLSQQKFEFNNKYNFLDVI
jgi:hypothetical protein